ncbi:Leukocyte receptor cluster member 1 [Sorochytrium milnesiophthora]
MNILPHKSWHVYNKDNVARVRRDEALAKAREDELKQRATEADREHRLQVLRARHRKDQDADATAAGADEPTSSASNMTGLTDAKGHINLFLDLEMAQQKHNKKENPDVVRERKAAEDKWERQYTMYLDQSKKGT